MMNDEIHVHIDSLSQDGRGVARLDGMVCFIEGAFPGEDVTASLLRKKKRMLEARCLRIDTPAPIRRQPICDQANCGGCALNSMEYQAQLEAKREIVGQQLARIGGCRDCTVLPMVGMDYPFAYRNRIRLVWDGQHLVFRAKGSHASGGMISNCRIASPEIMQMAKAVELSLQDGTIAFEPGGEVLLRYGQEGFVAFEGQSPARISQSAYEVLRAAGAMRLADGRHKERGSRPDVEYFLDGLTFAVSGRSFFQTNLKIAGQLFANALRLLAKDGQPGLLLDVYGGVGAPGLFFARAGWRVISIELDSLAVRDAVANAERNGLPYESLQGDAASLLPRLLQQYPEASLLVDPPRAGLSASLIAALLKNPPARLVMISCDPATMARDAGLLLGSGRYQLESVQPYDMFPWTHHIEVLALFARLA